MAKSSEIENKKQRRFTIIETTVNQLGFYKNEKQYKEMIEGKCIVVDFTKGNMTITINYFPKENGDVIMFSKKAPIKDKLRICNAMLANSLC